MVQPPLTEADQQSLTLQATQNQRRPEQNISVEFDVPPMSQQEWLARRPSNPSGPSKMPSAAQSEGPAS
jgi:hypothetical protein